MTDGMSAADLAAIMNSEGANGMNSIWNNPFIYFVWMALFTNGGFGFGNRTGEVATASTQAELQRGFDNQSVMNKLNGLEKGLYDGFYAMNTNSLNGFNGVQRDLCTGFSGVNQNINQARFDSQQCCCETNRNIDAVRYENSRNTCDIVSAIRSDGDQTRALINANTMQALRDKIAEKDRDIISRDFQLSQQAQNSYLVSQLRPCPIPAYPSCSPYAAFSWSDVYSNSGRNCSYCC